MRDQSRRDLMIGSAAALATSAFDGNGAVAQNELRDPAKTIHPGSSSDPSTILGRKLVAWFDATYGATLFADVGGSVPVTEGSGVALWRARNDPSIALTQERMRNRPIWSATAYNNGRSPGLVSRGAENLRTGPLALGRTSFGAIVAFEGPAENASGALLSLNTTERIEEDFGGPGSCRLIGINAAQRSYEASTARWTRRVPFKGFAAGSPVRLGVEYDGETARTYMNATASADGPSSGELDPNVFLSVFAQAVLANRNNVPGTVQHVILLNDALDAAERTALDAYLMASQGSRAFEAKLKSAATTGSMTGGSSVLTVVDPAGFTVGDGVIVEVGRERSTGYGTIGVGGVWPRLSAPTEAEIIGSRASRAGTFIRALDTAKTYKAKPDGSGYYAWDGNVFYTRYANPLSLVATITAIDGNRFTLDTPASATTTDANVYVDNAAILNAISGPDGLAISLPAGTYRQSRPWEIKERNDWTITGAGPTQTVLHCPPGVPSSNIRLVGCLRPVLRGLKVVGNHAREGTGLEYSGPDSFDSFGYGIRLDGTTQARLNDVDGRDTPTVFISFVYSSGVAERCRLDYTVAQQHYLGWQFQASNCVGNETVIFRDCVFDSDHLVPAWETFASTNVKFVRCRSRNGMFASNSSTGFLIDEPMVTITANCRDTSVLSPVHYGNGLIGINTNIATSSDGSNRAPGSGGIIRNPTIDVQGFMDAGGSVMRAIAISGASDVLVQGSYHAGPKDAHRGFIRAPIAGARKDSFSAGGPEIVADAPRTNVDGIRLVAYPLNGSGRWPTPYKPSISIYPKDTKGCAITNTVTGDRQTDITGLAANAGNISNAAYDTRP